MRTAAEASAADGIEWPHVDDEPQLSGCYPGCEFRPTDAGLLRLG